MLFVLRFLGEDGVAAGDDIFLVELDLVLRFGVEITTIGVAEAATLLMPEIALMSVGTVVEGVLTVSSGNGGGASC